MSAIDPFRKLVEEWDAGATLLADVRKELGTEIVNLQARLKEGDTVRAQHRAELAEKTFAGKPKAAGRGEAIEGGP